MKVRSYRKVKTIEEANETLKDMHGALEQIAKILEDALKRIVALEANAMRSRGSRS